MIMIIIINILKKTPIAKNPATTVTLSVPLEDVYGGHPRVPNRYEAVLCHGAGHALEGARRRLPRHHPPAAQRKRQSPGLVRRRSSALGGAGAWGSAQGQGGLADILRVRQLHHRDEPRAEPRVPLHLALSDARREADVRA